MNNKRFYETYDYPEQNFWLEKYLELKKKYNKQEKIIHDQHIIINNLKKKNEIEEKIKLY